MKSELRVAIVHYWLVGMRGGEKVVEALCGIFPQADIFTHAYDPESVSPAIRRHKVTTTFIGRLPAANRLYKRYLPLMPLALARLDLSGYDLVISSESGPAKGVRAAKGAAHVCYCHTPMRYLWNMYGEYRASAGLPTRLAMSVFVPGLRRWDRRTAARPDAIAANSQNVAGRIRKYWGREATVIHPPVEIGDFDAARPREDFYLCVGQLTGYKRIDLAVRAFSGSGRRLVVIGGGEEEESLRAMAGPEVAFLGRADDAVVRDHLSRCRAFVFPGEEDFGIAPVEALASGAPVIAYGRGGALEIVEDGLSGLFFHDQTPESLMRAVERLEASGGRFDAQTLRERARRFEARIFEERMAALIQETLRAKAKEKDG